MNVSIYAKNAAARFGNRTAFIVKEKRYTFQQFDECVDRLSTWLATRCARGARVCVMLGSGLPAVLLQFAIARAGLVRVPVNARYTAVELQTLVNDSGAEMVFYDSGTSTQANDAQSMLNSSERCQFVLAEDDGEEWRSAISAAIDVQLLHRNEPGDLASINYTSGTTANPKGVMLTHRHWLAVYRNLLIDRGLSENDLVAHVSPLSHAAGAYLEAWFLRGACHVIIDPTVDSLLDAIEKHGVTAVTCVPTFLTKLVASARLEKADCSSLRLISYGAEPISADTLKKCWDRFGPILWQNYGQTEAMITCAHLPPKDHLASDGSLRHGYIGRPYTFVEMVIRDTQTGEPVAPGQLGELTVRAEHVMAGYWKREAETTSTVRDGWLWTGDLAVQDASQLIRLVGRSKDMFICGGFNIYPAEVEQILTSHGLIVEAAVLPRPDPLWGEVPIAIVTVTTPDAPPQTEVFDGVFKPILGIKTPKIWTVISEMPKNNNGKIDKSLLKQRYC